MSICYLFCTTDILLSNFNIAIYIDNILKITIYVVELITVHPFGIPSAPYGKIVIFGCLTNVPVLATPLTQPPN
jgi:hypothetical protein